MEIRLGKGEVYIGTVERDGVHGILFRPTGIEHPIDSKDEAFSSLKEYEVKENDLVVWCKKLESARVLQDVANGLALSLNGYIVDDAADKGNDAAQTEEDSCSTST